MLTIYDDGSTSGIVANLWGKEIPSNGNAGQVLSYDGTSLTWVENHFTTLTNCDSSTEGKIRYDTSGAKNIMVGCLEDAGVYTWVQLSL